MAVFIEELRLAGVVVLVADVVDGAEEAVVVFQDQAMRGIAVQADGLSGGDEIAGQGQFQAVIGLDGQFVGMDEMIVADGASPGPVEVGGRGAAEDEVAVEDGMVAEFIQVEGVLLAVAAAGEVMNGIVGDDGVVGAGGVDGGAVVQHLHDLGDAVAADDVRAAIADDAAVGRAVDTIVFYPDGAGLRDFAVDDEAEFRLAAAGDGDGGEAVAADVGDGVAADVGGHGFEGGDAAGPAGADSAVGDGQAGALEGPDALAAGMGDVQSFQGQAGASVRVHGSRRVDGAQAGVADRRVGHVEGEVAEGHPVGAGQEAEEAFRPGDAGRQVFGVFIRPWAIDDFLADAVMHPLSWFGQAGADVPEDVGLAVEGSGRVFGGRKKGHDAGRRVEVADADGGFIPAMEQGGFGVGDVELWGPVGRIDGHVRQFIGVRRAVPAAAMRALPGDGGMVETEQAFFAGETRPRPEG